MVDITDVVTHTNFGDHRLRVFWERGVTFPPSPLTFIVVLTTLSHAKFDPPFPKKTLRACDLYQKLQCAEISIIVFFPKIAQDRLATCSITVAGTPWSQKITS